MRYQWMWIAGITVVPIIFSSCHQQQLDTLLNQQESASSCSPIKSKQSRIIESKATPLTSHYRLSMFQTQNGAVHYEALLNIRFVDERTTFMPLKATTETSNSEESTQPESSEDITQKMMEKTQNCIKAVAPYLKGPNGEFLHIRLHRNRPTRILPSEIKISVVSPGRRADMNHWAETMDCPLIIHEVFHHLGLVDEYKELIQVNRITESETDPLKRISFDCRSLGPDDSLMSNPAIAVMMSVPTYYVIKCQCAKPDKDATTEATTAFEECRSALKNLKDIPEACPAQSLASYITVPALDLDLPQNSEIKTRVQSMSQGKQTGFLTDDSQYTIIKKSELSRDSLLYPTQFRAIVSPGCPTTNETYYRCAANAYRTSVEHHGEGCIEELPDACQGNKTDWIKQ